MLCLMMGMSVTAETVTINKLRYKLNGTEACVCGCIDATNVVIPATIVSDGQTYRVTSIDNNTFYQCYNLTSVTIPNSVTSIGEGAFEECGLTSMTIPNSITSIGNRAFYECCSLTSVTISNSVTSIDNETFSSCYALTSVTIPNSVTSIGERAFYDCYGLTSVTIPNSVTSIGNHAFWHCSGLTSVTIPNSVTSIGEGAFEECDGLTSVTIPNSVTSIGSYAFDRCDYLTSVIIPSSVTSIGNGAFNNCDRLTSVTVEWNNPISIPSSTFLHLTGETLVNKTPATLYVPKGCKAAYEAADYWKDFKEIVEVGGLEEQNMSLNELPTMTYGDVAHELPATTIEGLTLAWAIEDETIAEISGNTLTIKGAGTTTVTATQTGNDEYEAFERTFMLTVNKAPLTITANDCTKLEGEENPDLTVSYEGFVYNDDISSLTTLPSITTTATTESPAGTYPITASGAEAANYEITYVEGTLTVTEAPVLASSGLYVAETTVLCGSQETLPVVFESEIAYGGLQCELTLPEGITLSKVTKTERLTDDFILQKNQTGDNTYQILLYNTNRLSFAGNDGALFTLTVDVDDEMAVGDYTLMLKDIVVSTIDEQQDDLPDFSGTIHVEDYMIGDANRDNRVNVTDIMAIANYILRIPGNNFNEKAADLNGDNRVNVTDIMGVANIILRVNTTQNAPWNGQMLDPQ